MKCTSTVMLAAIAIAAIELSAPRLAVAADATPENVVDALNTIFGKKNVRSSHAKGQCVKGTYTPSAEAASLTKSTSFTTSAPFIGRFSMGGGNPAIPDATKTAVRGFAFRLDAEGKSPSEFAFISAPVQFAKNLDQMLGFLQARFPGADGKPDQEKIKAFAEANPETTAQGKWVAGKPVPASYAGVNYWGVHAYTAKNAAGEAKVFKFKLVPAAGEAGLSDDEAKAKPADFLIAELTDRLAKGPVSFDVIAILGEAGDPADNPTALWPEESRKTLKLGTLAVTALEDNKTCDGGVFDPTVLADGIEGPQNDTIFAARSPAYAISITRRAN